MKTKINIIIAFCILSSLILITSLKATTYSWVGNTSTDWGTAANWGTSPGVPSVNDTVTITSTGTYQPVLDQNRTVKKFTMTSGTLNLNTYDLTISNTSAFTAGTISNGKIYPNGVQASYFGTTFNCEVNSVAGKIFLSGSTFNYRCYFEDSITNAAHYGAGGNTFNAPVVIKKNSGSHFGIANTTGNTFNDSAAFLNVRGTNTLVVTDQGTTYFNGHIFVGATTGGDVYFSGASTLASGKTINVDATTGYTSGDLRIYNMTQSGSTAQSFTLTGAATVNCYNNTWNGAVTFTAPHVIIRVNTFNSTASLIQTSTTTGSNSDGGNTFNGAATISCTGGSQFRLGMTYDDTFNSDLTVSGNVQIGAANTTIIKGNLTAGGSNTHFNSSGVTGTLKFAGSNSQHISSNGTGVIGFNKIKIDKTGGSVTLDTTITVDDTLTFVNKNFITTSSHLLSLLAGSTVTGTSNSSFISGPVKKTGNTAFIFPTGKGSEYRAIEISAPSVSTNAFTAEYFNAGQSLGTSKDSTIDYMSRCNYWSLTRNSGSSTPTVKLNWDTIDCGIFDTTDLRIINWNGSKWKDLGKGSVTGDNYKGKAANSTSVNTYGYFTLAYKAYLTNDVIPGVGNTYSISPDFFGYNGSNTIVSQTWDDLNNAATPVLKNKAITSLRYPAGTVANYWDWRKGWFFPESELPHDWFYQNGNYAGPLLPGDKLEDFKISSDWVAGRPIFVWNPLISDYYYQMASLYEANHLNLPLKYVEFGNEFYLNDEQYKMIYPSVWDYAQQCNDWCNRLKTYTPFQNVKVAAVGAQSSHTDAGRRRMWLKGIIKYLDPSVPSKQVDALTIHQYIGSGLGGSPFGNTFLYKMMATPFQQGDSLLLGEFTDITNANSTTFASHPLRVWLTEYNLSDASHHNIGTWSHGLFTSAMTLKYLESDLIDRLTNHTLVNNAEFGNVFESNQGFFELLPGQLPANTPANTTTNQWEFTALGTALDQIAKATRNSTQRTFIDFSATIAHDIGFPGNTTGYLDLYGWVFDSPDGQQAIILNLGIQSYDLHTSPILTSATLKYEQIISNNLTTGIIGNAQIGAIANDLLNTSGEVSFGSQIVTLPGLSITRIFYDTPNQISIKVTDNEICASTGSYTSSTSIQVTGGSPNYTYVWSTGTTAAQPGDVYTFSAPSGITTVTNYTVTVTDGNSTTATASITVYPAITNISITPSSTQQFCKGGSPIQLSASFTAGNGGNNNLTYSFIWTPSQYIVSGSCGNGDLTPLHSCINVQPEKTTDYQVYITDGHCWDRSAPVTINVGGATVDAGDDVNICSGGSASLTATLTDNNYSGTIDYFWSYNSLITQTITVPSTGTYTVTVTQTSGGNTCTSSDQVTVSALNCCGSGSAIYLEPHTPDNISDEQDLMTQAGGVGYTVTGTTTVTINGNTGGLPVININGEFVITQPVKLTLEKCTLHLGENALIRLEDATELHLKGCVITACSGEMWKSIIVDAAGRGTSPEIEITDYISAGTFHTEISGGINPVYLARESPFKIENALFNDNYTDISLQTYQKAIDQDNPNGGNPVDDYFIRGNTFTSNLGGSLLPPYNLEHKLAAITLSDVENAIIGDHGTAQNEIENSQLGISSSFSGFECYNNEFHDIYNYDQLHYAAPGAAIVSAADDEDNDYLLRIGDAASGGSNNFHDCGFGIASYQVMNTIIANNSFGQSGPIDYFGVSIGGVKDKFVQIVDGNSFDDFNIGIGISGLNTAGNFEISNNTFTTANITPGLSFSGTAITIQNLLPITAVSAIIRDNTITDPRIGIHAENVPGIIIGGYDNSNALPNTISFSEGDGSSLTDFYTGIWLQQCDNAVVKINGISNDAVITSNESLMRGIAVDNSVNLNICGNTMTNMGYAMQFEGDCQTTRLKNNTMTDYFEGIHYELAKFSPQGSTGNPWDNQWIQTNSANYPNFQKVEGTYLIAGTKDWYFQGNDINNNPFSPNPRGVGLVNPNPNETGPSIDCELAMLADDDFDRDDVFGPVVGDTARYDYYPDEAAYLAKKSLFKRLTDNPSLLNVGSGADDSFEEFYEEMITSNIGQFSEVSLAVQTGDLTTASDLNEEISDENDIESNEIIINDLVLNKIAVGDTLDSSDTTALESIFAQHWLIGGNSVYSAAAILFKEYYSPDLALRKMQIHQEKESVTEVGNLKIYPNPTNGKLFLSGFTENNNTMEVFDCYDRLVYQSNNVQKNKIIDFSNMKSGIYYVRVLDSSGKYFKTNFVLLK